MSIESLIDIEAQNEGSIWMLFPRTEAGEAWIRANIGPDNGYQPYYPALIVEPRYVADILGGAVDDGLVVAEED